MDYKVSQKDKLIIQDIYRKVVNDDGWKDWFDANQDEALAQFDLDEEGKKLVIKLLSVF